MKEKYIEFSQNKDYTACLAYSATIDIKNNLEPTKQALNEFNWTYRNDISLVSDDAYDALLETYLKYDPESDVNKNWDSNKLPITMTGLAAVKNHNQYLQWLKTKDINLDTIIVCTPKYDGASLLTDESHVEPKVWTGGDKSKRVESHYEFINHFSKNSRIGNFYAYGEVIISRKNFSKYEGNDVNGRTYNNARNMVSGLFNSNTPKPNILSDVDYIRYGYVNKSGIEYDKSKQLDILNQLNPVKVPYKKFKASEITLELITDLFNEWNVEYELDGIVIDIDSAKLIKKIGRSDSTEPIPNYTRKYKAKFEEVKKTKIIRMHADISKLGTFTPVFYIEPTSLNGATVEKVTGNNFKHVNDYKISVGDTIEIKRSGMVIPKIIKIGNTVIPFKEDFASIEEFEIARAKAVAERVNESVKLYKYCSSCGSELNWDENKVHLQCENENCPGIKFKRIASFFEIMEVDGFKEATIKVVTGAGFDTVEKILKMSKVEFLNLEGFANTKAENTYNSIQSKMKDVNLSQLQHASCLFGRLGTRKLDLINNKDKNTILIEVKGLSDKTINVYNKNINKFNEFISNLPITIETKKQQQIIKSDKFKDFIVVFTGVRDKELQQEIIENGGVIGSGISKKTTHLICKDKNSTSSKINKARDNGVKIFELDEFKQLNN